MKIFVVIISLLIVALSINACGSGDKAVSDGELFLTFDGDSCTYKGPTLLKAGHVTLVFFNESEETAAAGLGRHTGDETIQDVIDYIGEEPDTKDSPTWSRELGAYQGVPAGESFRWEGDLEPGIHHIVCINMVPHLVWFGTGLTVEE